MNVVIKPAPVRVALRIEAKPAGAFEMFTSGMGRWWNKSHSLGTSLQRDVIIEPRPGGRWFERGEDGSESDWGRVLVWEPPSRLVLAWQLNADWRFDPSLETELELRFKPDGEHFTRVELEHRNLERFGDKAEAVRASIGAAEGWPGLLRRYADAFKS
jgi:uncharacterized protein YndB with AHSA1/START domain